MHVVILGNGISGITAARYIRKRSDHKVTVVSKETDYFFSRTALMYIYMGHMREKDTQPYEKWFWKKNRINLLRGEVTNIDFSLKELQFAPRGNEVSDHPVTDTSLKYDKLILALGSAPNKFGWPGQDLKRVQGLYSIQDLEGMEAHSAGLKRAVIVGGGLIGLEMAEMFHSRHIPVTMLVREKSFWNAVLPEEESQMINAHILEHGIDMLLTTELKEIVGNSLGEAVAVETTTGDKIDCQFVGLTAGVHPNVKWLQDTDLELGRGILVNERLETSIQDVYAIGDCAQLKSPTSGRRPIEAVWYTGRMMGETVAHIICGQDIAYEPGIWYNSAKFFDIEYQVYGTVLSKPLPDHRSLFWKHQDGKKSIRIVYLEASKEVIGFNLMGIRFRHEVCEKWISEKTHIEEVLADLALANFDPELFDTFHEQVVATYNRLEETNIKVHKVQNYNSVFHFLKKIGT